MILKPKSIPTQDDPENGKVGVGELRQDAIADAECRRAESGADQRVLEGQPWDCVQRARPRRNICLDTAGSDRAGVRQPGQDGARGSSRLYHESNWAEPAAGGAADSDVPGDGEGRATAVSTAAVSAEVYRRGCDIAGISRSGARADEWPGNAMHSETGIRRIRQTGICAPGGDLGCAHLQPAQQRGISKA